MFNFWVGLLDTENLGNPWKTILRQKVGCPMGGYISSFYANICCAYDEYHWHPKPRPDQNRIIGTRQMDDLLIWFIYNKNDKEDIEKTIQKIHTLTNNELYRDGLEIETEDMVYKNGKQVNIFAGCKITLDHANRKIECSTFNKNTAQINKHNRQKFYRFPNNSLDFH